MKNNSLKILLSILLIVVIIISGISVYNSKNRITNLKKQSHVGGLYSELQITEEPVKYTDTVSFRENLSGGDYKFEETIRVGDVFISAKKCGYVEGITDNKYVNMSGETVVNKNKYALFFVEIVNNSNEIINLDTSSFVMGYNKNDVMINISLPDNSYWGRVENSFSLNELPQYTRRTGYIYFPITETEFKDLYLKVDVSNVPIIFTK